MIAKLRHINRNVNPYGGILFCMNEVRNLKIPALIDKHLGKRAKQAKYSYSDTLLSWIYGTLCGSERLEDTQQLQPHFKDIPGSRLPSSDRIAWIFKKLSTPIYIDRNQHEFNVNMPLNELLVDVALQLKLINSNVMDYDNVIIPCEKYDAKYSYKKCAGYSPGVAFIGKSPVYIEGRNGNTPAKHKMTETVSRAIDLANKKGIKVKIFRSDAAAYSGSVIKMLVKNEIQFFIRARHSNKIFQDVIKRDDWQIVEMGNIMQEISSTDYEYASGIYRVVVTRCKHDNYKNKHTNDSYVYRAIITNNRTMSDKEVVHFYNKRGEMELNFTALLNDWSWKRLPFSFLNQNVAFMIIGAIGSLLYQHLIIKFSKKVGFVKSNFRLKNFIFHFIAVALEWVMSGGDRIPALITYKDYSPILGRPPCKKV